MTSKATRKVAMTQQKVHISSPVSKLLLCEFVVQFNLNLKKLMSTSMAMEMHQLHRAHIPVVWLLPNEIIEGMALKAMSQVAKTY